MLGVFFTFVLSRFTCITSPLPRYLDELASATRLCSTSCLFLNKEFHFSCDVGCVGVYFNERTWGKRNSIKVSYDGRSVTTHYHLFKKRKFLTLLWFFKHEVIRKRRERNTDKISYLITILPKTQS